MTTIERKPGTRQAWHKNRATHVSFREDEGEARLPGRTLTREQAILTETHVTFLPTCSICRGYPAYLVNGIYLCRGQHD